MNKFANIAAALQVSSLRQVAALSSLSTTVTRIATDGTSSSTSSLPSPGTFSNTVLPNQHLLSLESSDILEEQAAVIRRVSGPTGSTSSSGGDGGDVGSSLEGRRLSHLDLSLSKLAVSFNRSLLHATKFCGADLRKCTFHLSVLSSADFVQATCLYCSFLGADMKHVDARRATFANCKFVRCDMTNWLVEGASFINCEFQLCDLSGWTYDSQTLIRREGPARQALIAARQQKHQDVLPTCSWEKWTQSKTSVELVGPRDAVLVFQ